MSVIESNGHRFALDHDPDGNPFVTYACPHYWREIGVLTRLPRGLPGRSWTVEVEQPLTVTPSVHSVDCGCHGWIRNGEWVDA